MKKMVTVEISARHMHLSQEHLEILFGKGAQLTHKKDLSQPGQFACEERVDVVGPKKTQKGVSVLGPVRPETQVEVSLTDARSLGFAAPVRMSGETAGSPGCKLVGPKGEVELDHGVIVAKRHLHTTPEDAEKLGLADKQVIGLKIDSPDRSAILGDVVVRVHPTYATYCHIDTDEANAAGISGNVQAEIIE